jgi:hypothetical protein
VAAVGFLSGGRGLLKGGAALSDARLCIARATSASFSPCFCRANFYRTVSNCLLVRQARLGTTTGLSAPPIRHFRQSKSSSA